MVDILSAAHQAPSPAEPNAVIADQGMVYVRYPSGEVHAADASPLELMKKINRGIVVLTDYGQFGSSAYYMEHPYEPLFQAGGAREMSVAQIRALGFDHTRPIVPTCERHVGDAKDHLSHAGRPGVGSPKAQGCWRGARAVHFPQLDGLPSSGGPFECGMPGCNRDDLPTQEALKQHQAVMHSDRRQQQELGDAIVGGLQRSGMIAGGADPAAIAAAVGATLQALGYGAPKSPAEPPADDEDDEDGSPEPEPQPSPRPTVRHLTEAQLEGARRGGRVAAQRRAAQRGQTLPTSATRLTPDQ